MSRRGLTRAWTGPPRVAAPTRHHRGHPWARRSERPPPTPWLTRWTTAGVRRRGLQGPQRRRALFQPPQGLARLGHPLRQASSDRWPRAPFASLEWRTSGGRRSGTKPG